MKFPVIGKIALYLYIFKYPFRFGVTLQATKRVEAMFAFR